MVSTVIGAVATLALGLGGLLAAASVVTGSVYTAGPGPGGLGAGGMAPAAPGSGVGTAGGSVSDSPPVPLAMRKLYERAAGTCEGLSWALLAAIGTVESANGTSSAPGVHSGSNWAGAMGPMQFEPATFAAYDTPVPPGGANPPSPFDPTDAVYAAARDLCANGARGGADIPGAIYAYNHSQIYVAQVLAYAASFAASAPA